MPACRYVGGIGWAAKRSAGVIPEVNLREHATHTPPPNANKATHFAFETQRRRHQKSKTGVSVYPPIFLEKDLGRKYKSANYLSKNFNHVK